MDATFLATPGHWGAGPGWWPIFPILFWGLLFVGLFVFFRRRGGWDPLHPDRSGETVLAERYARGEISEQEYRERLGVLRQHKG